MNQTKRTLELCAGIFGIIVGAILCLGGILLVAELFELKAQNPNIAGWTIALVETIILIVFSTFLIIISALVCRAPKIKNDKVASHFGLLITITILTALLGIIELIGGQIAFGILSLLPCGLSIAAACLKHNKVVKESSIRVSSSSSAASVNTNFKKESSFNKTQHEEPKASEPDAE